MRADIVTIVNEKIINNVLLKIDVYLTYNRST